MEEYITNIFVANNMMIDTILFFLKKDLLQKNIEEVFYSSSKDKELNKELQSAFNDRIKKLSTIQPFFGDKILVILDTAKMEANKLLKTIEVLKKNKYLKIVLKSSSKELFDLVANCGDIPSKQLNLYKPSPDIVALHLNMYLSKEMTKTAFDLFIKKMRRQWKYLDDYIHILETDESKLLMPKDIERIIPKAEPIDFYNILATLLFGNNFKSTMIQVSNYRFAKKFLKKELLEKLDNIIKLKKDYNQAILRYDNMAEYAKTNKIASWELNRILEDFLQKVSLEWLLKIKYNIVLKENTVLEMILASQVLYV